MSRIASVGVLDTRLLVELKGCPELLRIEALRDACRQFCEDTGAWHEELTAIDIVDGTLTYNLIPQYDAHVQRIVDVWMLTADQVTAGTRGDPLETSLYDLTPGDPEVIELADEIEPTESITGGLIVKVALVPEFNAMDIAEWFLNRYWEALVARAKVLRMLDPGERWSNPQKAGVHQSVYLDVVNKAKAEVTRAFKEAPSLMPM